MKHSRRIVYIPGLISLIALPVLITMYMNREVDKHNRYRILEVTFNNSPIHLQRNWLEIELTGDEKTDETKLDFAQIQAQNIQAKNDTTNGIHISLNPTATYGSFVAAINMLRRGEIQQSLVQDDGIWILKTPSSPNSAKRTLAIGYLGGCIQNRSLDLDHVDTSMLRHYRAWLGGTGLLFFTLVGIAIYNARKNGNRSKLS